MSTSIRAQSPFRRIVSAIPSFFRPVVPLQKFLPSNATISEPSVHRDAASGLSVQLDKESGSLTYQDVGGDISDIQQTTSDLPDSQDIEINGEQIVLSTIEPICTEVIADNVDIQHPHVLQASRETLTRYKPTTSPPEILPDNNSDDQQSLEEWDEQSWKDNEDRFSTISSEYPGSDQDIWEDELASSTTTQELAITLYRVIQGTDNGCGAIKHEEEESRHIDDAGDNHFRLEATYCQKPPTIDYKDCCRMGPECTPNMFKDANLRLQPIGISGNSFLQTKKWRSVFEGQTHSIQETDNPNPHGIPQKNICLHLHQRPETQWRRTYDIDGFGGEASDLAVASRGIAYHGEQTPSMNIRASLHWTMTIPSINRAGKEKLISPPLYLIPHVYLGSVLGAQALKIYIFFPGLFDLYKEEAEKQNGGSYYFRALNSSHARAFYTLFLGAVHNASDSQSLQHLPSDPRSVELANRATREQGISSHRRRQTQNKQYTAHADSLKNIWSLYKRSCTSPGNYIFNDSRIFINAKNTKLEFKGDSFASTIRQFRTWMNHSIASEYLPQHNWWLDIASELGPTEPLPREQPASFIFRNCCLRSITNSIAKGSSGISNYTLAYLRDTGNASFEPSKSSSIRKAGLLYFQAYNCIKEPWDAGKNLPFSYKRFDELAVDPKIYKVVRTSMGDKDSSKRETLLQSFKNSTRRVHEICQTDDTRTRSKNYSVRVECRVTGELLDRIGEVFQERQRTTNDEDEAQVQDDELELTPDTVWSIDTDVFFDFIAGNANKFLLGFCATIATGISPLSWEKTQLAIMFLQLLEHLFTAPRLGALPGLAKSRTTIKGREYIGLDLQRTIDSYGYAWLDPVVDWEKLVFEKALQQQVAFGLRLQHWSPASHGISEPIYEARTAISYLQRFSYNDHATSKLVTFLVQLVLREFRRTVVQSFRKLIAPHLQSNVDLIEFTEDGIKNACQIQPHIVKGNRSDYKWPASLVEFYFGFSNTIVYYRLDMPSFRKPIPARKFDTVPFRNICAQVRQGLAIHPHILRKWETELLSSTLTEHNLLPYPDPQGGLTTGAGKGFGGASGGRSWMRLERERSLYNFPSDYPKHALGWKCGPSGGSLEGYRRPPTQLHSADQLVELHRTRWTRDIAKAGST